MQRKVHIIDKLDGGLNNFQPPTLLKDSEYSDGRNVRSLSTGGFGKRWGYSFVDEVPYINHGDTFLNEVSYFTTYAKRNATLYRIAIATLYDDAELRSYQLHILDSTTKAISSTVNCGNTQLPQGIEVNPASCSRQIDSVVTYDGNVGADVLFITSPNREMVTFDGSTFRRVMGWTPEFTGKYIETFKEQMFVAYTTLFKRYTVVLSLQTGDATAGIVSAVDWTGASVDVTDTFANGDRVYSSSTGLPTNCTIDSVTSDLLIELSGNATTSANVTTYIITRTLTALDVQQFQPQGIRVSDPFDVTSTTALSFPDDQYLEVRSAANSYITGIKAVNQALIVFKTDSTWIIEGDSFFGGGGGSPFSLRKISDYGCISNGSIQIIPRDTGSAAIFLGKDGWYLTDGYNVYPASQKKLRLTMPIPSVDANHVDSFNVTSCYYPDEKRYYCSIPESTTSAANAVTYSFNVENGAWDCDDKGFTALGVIDGMMLAAEKAVYCKYGYFPYDNNSYQEVAAAHATTPTTKISAVAGGFSLYDYIAVFHDDTFDLRNVTDVSGNVLTLSSEISTLSANEPVYVVNYSNKAIDMYRYSGYTAPGTNMLDKDFRRALLSILYAPINNAELTDLRYFYTDGNTTAATAENSATITADKTPAILTVAGRTGWNLPVNSTNGSFAKRVNMPSVTQMYCSMYYYPLATPDYSGSSEYHLLAAIDQLAPGGGGVWNLVDRGNSIVLYNTVTAETVSISHTFTQWGKVWFYIDWNYNGYYRITFGVGDSSSTTALNIVGYQNPQIYIGRLFLPNTGLQFVLDDIYIYKYNQNQSSIVVGLKKDNNDIAQEQTIPLETIDGEIEPIRCDFSKRGKQVQLRVEESGLTQPFTVNKVALEYKNYGTRSG